MEEKKSKWETKTKYNREHYEQLNLKLPKGTKQFLKEYAAGNNISVAKLVTKAIEEYCNVDFSNDFGLKN